MGDHLEILMGIGLIAGDVIAFLFRPVFSKFVYNYIISVIYFLSNHQCMHGFS